MIHAGEGRYRVTLEFFEIGNDRLVIITGGEEAHIGSATLMDGKKGLQTISKKGHKDYVISEKMASIIYDTIEKDLLVVCGIHIENASKEEIDLLISHTQKCVDIFLKEKK
ncbi:hypothetical protein YH65_09750 [Sulfurovum lithotrophicum]|uniref:Prenylated flavin chaperone LpdD-like domain-containing protein n=1 Tax=Sulfurovum lithotrophicum TaxID=206403 RepID=A0A7U4RRC4_9BACT|nr:hypothetical protein [Sulfurovum lithotrophicum]AKF25631.1 hypothetical protein YH65_09750 [Sulfurovum lithotrophicum]